MKACDVIFKLLSELFLGERLTKHMKYFNRECELDSKQLKLQVCEGCVTLDTDVLTDRVTSLLQD
jgi:hypothetical protein